MLNLRRLILILLLILGLGLVLAAVGSFAVRVTDRDLVVTGAVRVTSAGLNPTPIAPFAALDPAVIAALQGPGRQAPFAVLPGVRPIGAYLNVGTPVAALPSFTPTFTPTPTITPSATYTLTPSETATYTLTPSGTHTPSPIPTETPTASDTFTSTPTRTATFTPSPTRTRTPLPTPTPAPSFTPRPSVSPFPTTIPIIDPGIQAIYGLQMTPRPDLVGDNCAPSSFPVRGLLTQDFNRLHGGIDIGADMNTPVQATQSGQVIFAGWSKLGYGYLVIVQNGHYITYYGHNSSFNVRQWQYVHKGDILSYSGSTGNSNGPHVHYETRIDTQAVDPLTFDQRNLRTC